MKRTTLWVVLLVLATALSARADANALYGIHWWGHTYGSPVDSTPAVMLQSQAYGAWDVETILTHSDYWWKAWYFEPLYATMATQYNVSVITRIDYQWGETIPAPSSPDHSNWSAHVCGIMGALGQYGHLWVLGNEPNLLDEGHNWTNQQVTPQGYAAMYRRIHNAITNTVAPSPRGPHKLLIAGASPGPVQPGVRWMNGTNWLDEVLAAIPSNEVDGVAIHAYAGSLDSFHNDYVASLRVLDRRGLRQVPVYMTEFNKYATPGDTPQESLAAEFIRQAYADLHAWNTTGANHNVICACWFVYDADQQSGGGWNGYSIEYWKNNGLPPSNPGDEYTAYTNAVSYHYPAGISGTTPEPAVLLIALAFISTRLLHTHARTLSPDLQRPS